MPYSRICQGNKKPININKNEINEDENVFEYWNFT